MTLKITCLPAGKWLFYKFYEFCNLPLLLTVDLGVAKGYFEANDFFFKPGNVIKCGISQKVFSRKIKMFTFCLP